MNTMLKLLLFSAPVFFVAFFVYIHVHKKFQADFAVENVRFEQQWQNWEKQFGVKRTDEEFLKKQEQEAKELWGFGQRSAEKLQEMETDFDKVLKEMDEAEAKAKAKAKAEAKVQKTSSLEEKKTEKRPQE